jgi:hypothetical protein
MRPTHLCNEAVHQGGHDIILGTHDQGDTSYPLDQHDNMKHNMNHWLTSIKTCAAPSIVGNLGADHLTEPIISLPHDTMPLLSLDDPVQRALLCDGSCCYNGYYWGGQ